MSGTAGEPSPAQPAGRPRPARRFAGWRVWAMRLLLAVASPALLLAGLELGLRAAGYGWPAGFFRRLSTGAIGANDRFAHTFSTAPLGLRGEPLAMSPRKKPGALRIFILGESAAQGVPDASYSFGRILHAMLRRVRPEADVEVINTGVTAINSHIVRLIARDCARYEPDLFIIYMGNNEVTGPWGPGTIFRPFSGSLRLIRASIQARSLRTGQLIGSLLRGFGDDGPPAEWRGMEAGAGNVVPPHDPRRRTVYEHFRANLRDIIDIGRSAGAHVIVCTVGVNLRDCPPFASAHRPDLGDEDRARWRQHYDAGAAAEKAGDIARALACFEQAAAIDDGRADLVFRMARCHLAAGRVDVAKRLYGRARDLDALQFRTDSVINQTIRDIARSYGGRGVALADIEDVLTRPEHSPHGIPGRQMFWEHVHMTFDANHAIARELLPHVLAAMQPGRSVAATPPAVPDVDECRRMLAYTPFDRRRLTASMLEMISRPPFTAQIDHDIAVAAVLDALRSQAPTPADMRQSKAMYEQAIAARDGDWMLRLNFASLLLAMGDAPRAVSQMEEVLKVLPDERAIRLSAADAALAAGQLDRAERVYRELLQRDRSSAELHKRIGDVLLARGQVGESIGCYRRALELRARYHEAHLNLGTALRAAGDLDGAAREFRTAIEMVPDAAAHGALAGVLLRQGKAAEALAHYRAAVAIAPYSAAARNNLGALLLDMGYVNEATEHARAAVEADANYAKAYGTLGQALWRKGEMSEAAACLRKSIALGNRPPIVQSTLALILATASDTSLRNGNEALALAQEACALTNHQRAFDLEALAAAHAELGRFDEAVKIAQNARERAISAGSRRQAERIASQIESYAARRPWRAQ